MKIRNCKILSAGILLVFMIGTTACNSGNGEQVYFHNSDAFIEMLILAAPIYYHGISGQLKCVIDRFYSALYPTAPATLKKVAMFLSSGDDNMYDGAKFSYDGDFLGYLGLEGMGIFTNHDNDVMEKIRKMASSL